MLLVGDYEGDSPLSNMLPNQSQFLLSELPKRHLDFDNRRG